MIYDNFFDLDLGGGEVAHAAASYFVLPTILAYTALSYVIFRGKATELRYD